MSVAYILMTAGLFAFLLYMVGALLSMWTFFGVPVSFRP